MQKLRKHRHLRTIEQLCRAISSQLRHALTIGKLVKQQYLLHSPHNMVNVSPLTAEIGWRVLDTPANFSGGFVTAPTSLNGGQPHFARCLAVCRAGTLYIFGRSCSLTEFCHVHNSRCVQCYGIILAALLHGTRAVGVSQTAAWYLHATGRPFRSTLGGRTV